MTVETADRTVYTDTPWVQTASGRTVTLLGPGPIAISIRDIAAHLSKICRFAGATDRFYSVAQHSVLVSNLCFDLGPDAALHGLLHDAHEAYIGDMPQPAKLAMARMLGSQTLSPLDDLKHRLDRAIAEHIGLSYPVSPQIRAAIHHGDLRALATEKRDLLTDEPDWPDDLPAPWRAAIKPWPWAKAEEKFLEQFDELAALAGLAPLAEHAR
jgi:hypothetical protein